MQHLSKQLDKVIRHGDEVNSWIAKRDQALQTETLGISSPIGACVPVGAVVGVTSIFLCLITAALNSTPQGMPSKPWPVIGWLFVTTLFGGFITATAAAIWGDRQTNKMRTLKRQILQRELDADPLYVRAKLIQRALNNYQAHLAKYRAWFDAVDEGLTDRQDEEADRYHAFIDSSHRVLVQAVSNFTAAAELARRQEEYRQSRPELAAKPENTALADLIAQLDKPVEMPPEVALADPREALGFEETLGQLSADSDDKDLTQRIEAASARSALSAAKTG